MTIIDRGRWNAFLNNPLLHNGIGTPGDTYTVGVDGYQDIGNELAYYRTGQRLTLGDDLIYRVNSGGTINSGFNNPDLPDILGETNIKPYRLMGLWNAYLNEPFIHNLTDGRSPGDTFVVGVEGFQDIGNGSTYFREGQVLTLGEDLMYYIGISSTADINTDSPIILPPTSIPFESATVGSSTESAVITYNGNGEIISAYNELIDMVPPTRSLTINGTSYDLSQDRIWNISVGSASMATLTDVNLSGLSNGDLLKYDSGTLKWIVFTPPYLTSVSFADLTSHPTTIAGYGITDPIVYTSGSYANPAWITSLAWSKITGAPVFTTTYAALTDVNLTSIANGQLTKYDSGTSKWINFTPTYLTSVAFSDLTSHPTTLAGYGITDPIVLTSGSYANPSWITSLAYSKITGVPSFITLADLSASLPLSYNNSTGVFTIAQSTTSTDGYLSSTDWNIFNSKQSAITTGTTSQYFRGDLSLATFPTIPTVTPSALTKADDTNVTLTLGGTPSTALLQATSLTLGWTGTLADGRIASASTWNAKENALTFNAPLSRSVNTISIPAATSSVNGYLTSTDWSTFNSKESALTFSTGLTRTVNTITVNASQNISTLSNLTTNGIVKTSGGTGALSVSTGTGIVKSTAGTISYLADPLPLANGGTEANLSALYGTGLIPIIGVSGFITFPQLMYDYFGSNNNVLIGDTTGGSSGKSVVGSVLSVCGQEAFSSGLGTINHLLGPADGAFYISSALTTGGAGNNLNLITSDTSVLNTASGNINLTTGASNGNADGGYINLTATKSTGSNGRGGVVVITANGRTSTGDNTALSLISNLGDVVIKTSGTNTTIIGNVNVSTHAAASANSGVNAGAINHTTGLGGAGLSSTIGAGGVGGAYLITMGGGGSAPGGNSGINGGAAGDYSVVGGTGGAAAAAGTHTGGRGSNVALSTGAGGNATGASGTRTGGDSGSMTFTIGAVGTGATANGTLGTFNFVGSKTNFPAPTTSYASANYASGTAPTTPVEGDLWVDSTQKTQISFSDGIKQARPGVIYTQTADKTVSNTTTETSIIGTGVGTLTLPANFFVAGKTVRLRIGGVYTTSAIAPSILIKVKYGSTVIATVTTTSLLASGTNLEFDGEMLITCRTTGATGTVMVHGDIEYATGVAGTISVDPLNNAGATTTIDTTASSLLDVTVTWDSATATRTVKSTITTVEVLN